VRDMWLAVAGLFLIALFGLAVLGYAFSRVLEAVSYNWRGG
jgi:hypothetical protein